MSDVRRLAHFDASERKFTFETRQDVEPIIDEAKHLAAESQRSDWGRHKWKLPLNMVNKFYYDYCGGVPKPLDAEFWAYVDRQMEDPEYKAFRVDNPSNPFFIGYGK